MGNVQSAVTIADQKVHILIDAQGHTLGSRQSIVALKPAPIVVSYLVYPGTMGASFVDYFIVDPYVIVAEFADAYYSEKLVLLPHCYQVNYYPTRNELDVATTRRDWHLPENGFVFANLNKNDKIEPVVFSVWMNILRKVKEVNNRFSFIYIYIV